MSRKICCKIAGILLLALLAMPVFPQEYRIMFYNTENLFDPFDDTLKKDEDFLPGEDKHWTYGRFSRKLVHLYRVIASTGEDGPPAIIGLCEVENRFVLEQLVRKTPLSGYPIGIIHQESPDPRGIDVALLYRKDIFRVSGYRHIPVTFPFSSSKTRDILLVKGFFRGGDTLYILVNHWPSRSGGALGSEDKRIYCGSLVRSLTDSIMRTDSHSCIVVMGDLNDEPGDRSVRQLTGETSRGKGNPGFLVNLMQDMEKGSFSGTIHHGGFWQTFDQILVSMPMVDGTGSLQVIGNKAKIAKHKFLLENAGEFRKEGPARTYRGPVYTAGYSDHLPVYVDLETYP